MKIKNQFWKLVTVGMILFCICFAGVINALAIDTPWIDMSQVTTQEETNEETQTPSEEGTTTPSQGTTGDKESEETANNEQTTPTDGDAETTDDQNVGEKKLFGGCKSAISAQTEGMVLLMGCMIVVACALKKSASRNA